METALLVVAVFGLSSATLDFYLDMEESKLLGLDRPLYYIKKGLINKVAFNPAYQIAMPVDKTNIRFSWRSKSQWIYTIRFRSSDESIMHRPTSKTLDPLGLVPRNVSVFDVTLDCTGQKGGLAFFELSLNVTDPSSVLVLAIDRPKRCRQETNGGGSSNGYGGGTGSVSNGGRSWVYYIAVSVLGTVVIIVLIVFTGYQYRRWQDPKIQKRRRIHAEAELCTLRSLPGGETLTATSKTQVQNGNCADSGYASHVVDGDRVLAVKLRSVAIDRSRVVLSTVLKQGSYGVFCRGTLLHSRPIGEDTDGDCGSGRQSQLGEEVLVKAITSSTRDWEIQQFMISVGSLVVNTHRNVLNILGVSSAISGSPVAIYPLVVDGQSLKDLLMKRRETDAAGAPLQPLSVPQLVYISAQFARGINHLARNGLVHKDIAARNCLVTSQLQVRVMDGALGMDLFPGEYDTVGENPVKLPIRWMSAECLTGHAASTESDVWSFGVAMWEIMTHGDVPYESLKAEGLLMTLQDGQRLEQPSSCPNQIFSLMGQCWALSPEDRPSFHQLTMALHEFYAALTCFI